MKSILTNRVYKRNAVVATVLLFVCAGIYLNWAYQRNQQAVDLTETLNSDLLTEELQLVVGEDGIPEEILQEATALLENDPADSFAQIRLNRQQSRDKSVELLQETIAYETGSDETAATAASTQLNEVVGLALQEANIESMIIAKGFEDCVCFMNDDLVSVAVNAPAEGLSEVQVAQIADIVLSQSDYELSEIRVVEVH